jgi:hypothetical protein
MNKKNEIKQMIRNGGKDRGNGWISQLRWSKWLEMVEMERKYDE